MKKVLCLLIFCAIIGCVKKEQPQIQKTQPMNKKIEVYDFSAAWCPPCRLFAPTFDEWSKKYSNDYITFFKVDTDSDMELTAKFKISALPTVVIVHDGKEVKRFVGPPSESQILEYLK